MTRFGIDRDYTYLSATTCFRVAPESDLVDDVHATIGKSDVA